MKVIAKTFNTFLLLISVLAPGCISKNAKTQRALDVIALRRGEITLCGSQEFGEVDFSILCHSDSRKTFQLGISLLHSFEYEEAEKAFVKTIDLDPDCAMAYWGVAMSNFHSLWSQKGNEYLEKGSRVLEVAQSLPKSVREQDYIDAVHVFYKDWQSIDRTKRILLFENKMKELYEKYPEDKEAAIFYSLALIATANPADKKYKNQIKAGKILESMSADQPDHPGIAHYIIHTYDYPELAAQALSTARRYAEIAPASAHAQHMPSHIFTRLGLWQESIRSNMNSTASALCYGQSIDSTGHWDEELHGMDYLVYAYLQAGENEKALQQLDYLNSFRKVFPVSFKVAYAMAAIPSRIALENKNWLAAAQVRFPPIEIDWTAFPWEKSIVHFTRALGAVRSGDIESSKNELALLTGFHQRLLEMGETYKAGQVSIQIKTVSAWISFAEGNDQEAIRLMEEAVHMEYSTTKHPVTPGEVLPAGELLGDLYMAMGNPVKALKAYEFDLQQHPNRFNGLYGAAIAARAINDDQKAAKYFEALLLNTQHSETHRIEIADARKFIEARRSRI
jgi:tetratricopeptide (TPR) repeat protein